MSTITGAPDYDFTVPVTIHKNGTITFRVEERFGGDFVVRFIVDPLSDEATALILLKKELKP